MKKRFVFSMLLIIILTGCWDIRDLSDYAIISAIGIDKVDDKYEVSFQIAKTREFSDKSSGEAKYIVYSGIGISYADAYHNALKKVSKFSSADHVQYMVIGEAVAKEDLKKIFDPLLRNQTVQSKIHVYLTKEYTAKDIISVLHDIMISAKNPIVLKNESSLQASSSIPVSIGDIEYNLPLNGKDLFIPLINIEGIEIEKGFKTDNNMSSRNDVIITLDGIGLFVDNKLKGYMTDKEVKGVLYVDPVPKPIFYNFVMEDNCVISGYSKKLKAKIKYNDEDNGKFNIDISDYIIVRETTCNLDFSDPKTIKLIEQKYGEHVKETVENSIKKAKSIGSDVYGFGEILRRSDNKEWKKIKEDWNEIFKTIEVDIDVDINVRDIGSINNLDN